MKRINILALVVLCLTVSNISISQIDPNSVPATGNVGLGTLFPEEKLHVVGNTKVDSSVIVNGGLYVNGPVVLDNAITVNENKSIDVVSPIQLSETSVNGLATFNNGVDFGSGVLFSGMNGQNDVTSLDKRYFLTIDNFGNLSTTNVADLIFPGISGNGLPAVIDMPCLQMADGSPAPAYVPTWAYGPGKIYTDMDCYNMKLGINNDNPTHSLTVNGDGIITKLRATNNLESLTTLKVYNEQYNKAVFQANNDGSFVFQNQYQKILQLDASGMLRAREIKVDLTNWPDYVFDKKYELMSIYDLEHYIDQNNHLPGFKPRQQMLEEGMNLTEVNVKMVEKIEELTLYIISLQAQIDELKNQH
jgi:hypothetical protein